MGGGSDLRKITKQLRTDLKTCPELEKIIQERHIQFHPTSPAAPHHNGISEAAVKSTKNHLKRVTEGHSLTLEEFRTITVKIEAMLNSRPLAPLSSDPNDLAPLTPAHFLIGRALVSPLEPDYSELPSKKFPAKRWRRVQAITQSFWKRWGNEYLHTLQMRHKWINKTRNLKIDDLVLIHDHSTVPLHWKMGRIVQLHPGSDGQVRVVRVRTSTGDLTRPVVKLYPLPMETDDSDPEENDE